MEHRKLIGVLTPVLLTLLVASCGAKKNKGGEHFGTEINWPRFTGPADLLKSLARVEGVLIFHRLDGQPVDMKWIEPKFREQLCLTVTIANHCVA